MKSNRIIFWSYLIIIIPCLFLLFIAINQIICYANSPLVDVKLIAHSWNPSILLTTGILQCLSCALGVLGVVRRDLRFISANALTLIPICLFHQLESVIQAAAQRRYDIDSKSIMSAGKKASLASGTGSDSGWVVDVLLDENVMFAVILVQLVHWVASVMMPTWLSNSLRLHKIVARMILLFRIEDVHPDFYQY